MAPTITEMYKGRYRKIAKDKDLEDRNMVGEGEGDESGRGEQRGGKGKTNILSPPGTQLAARGCCL